MSIVFNLVAGFFLVLAGVVLFMDVLKVKRENHSEVVNFTVAALFTSGYIWGLVHFGVFK